MNISEATPGATVAYVPTDFDRTSREFGDKEYLEYVKNSNILHKVIGVSVEDNSVCVSGDEKSWRWMAIEDLQLTDLEVA